MTRAEKHVRHYNHLSGKPISRRALKRFHAELKADIEKRRIDEHMPLGVECIAIEKKLARALKKINGGTMRADVEVIDVDKILALHRSTPKDPATTRAADRTGLELYGIERIQDDSDYIEGQLDGIADTAYKVITDRILELIKSDQNLVWRKAWNLKANGPIDMAHNYVTKTIYRGGNMYLNWLLLPGGMKVRIKGEVKKIEYTKPYFFTFKQVTALGGKVKAGETAWPVIYFKWLYKNLKTNQLVDEKEATQIVEGVRVLREGYDKVPGIFYYNVFNYDQCEGLNIKETPVRQRTEKEKIESAEAIVNGMPNPPTIRVQFGDRAFYLPHLDVVVMPKLEQFDNPQEFYSTLFHELVHSTGAKHRLNRDMTGRYGSKPYAFEELIAELGASFLCGWSGILYFTLKNSAAYIRGWSKRLVENMTKDPKFFVQAASKAQQAADYILNLKENDELTTAEATQQVKEEITQTREKRTERHKTRDRKPAKKETSPRPRVKASVSAAIDDLVKSFPEKYGKKARAMQMLYSTFKDSPNAEVELEHDSLKFKLLDKEGWIERTGDVSHTKSMTKGVYRMTDAGGEVFTAIKGRLSSLRTKKQGAELFPGLRGFTPADHTPEAPKNLFQLPDEIGRFLGKLQPYKLEIVVAGETHSSKSELGKQLANAFAEAGFEVGYIDWEQGGLESRDTIESIQRNISVANRRRVHVSASVPRTVEALKKLAGKFPVIIVDSGSKLNEVTNAWIDTLREQHPETVWVILMQQNTRGGTRGGTAAEFDAPVVIKTYRPDHKDFRKNYAYMFKNRGNPTGLYYSISEMKLIDKPEGDAN